MIIMDKDGAHFKIISFSSSFITNDYPKVHSKIQKIGMKYGIYTTKCNVSCKQF